MGLRNAGGDEFRIATADGTLVGTVDGSRAFRLVHPGAVYLHQGRSWRVASLDLDDRVAVVEPADGGEYTQPRTATEIAVLDTEQERTVGAARLAPRPGAGRGRRSSATAASTPSPASSSASTTSTCRRASWSPGRSGTSSPDEVLADAGVGPAAVPGALHAAEHAAIGILPLFTICDRWDVGGVSTPCLPETGASTIVIYDGYPGGAGVAELGYAAADRHLAATLDVIESCGCRDGCPSCVQSPKCGNGNDPLDKAGAIRLLAVILDGA